MSYCTFEHCLSYYRYDSQAVADPGFPNGGGARTRRRRRRGPCAVGARIEAPRMVGVGRGCPLPTGEGSGEGAVPPPQKI